MKRQLVICDRDKRYCQMMQSYLTKRLKCFEVLVFENPDQAVEYSRRQSFAILLVSENLYETGLQEIQANQIYILRENGEKAIKKYPYIEKYQSMERLISDILEGYADEMHQDADIYRKKARIQAFYSPVGHREQTKAALALGQVLAEAGKRVLYLNLQPFAGLEEQRQNCFFSDITDLLYFMRRQEKKLTYRIQAMKQTIGDIDYLPPAVDYMDLLKIPEQEWMTLLDGILETGEYSELILDLSEICQGLYRILERSECVYSMAGRADVEQEAIQQYKMLLEKRELSNILEKTKWLELPQGCMERVAKSERLVTTPLGEYMKGLIRENGNRQI